VSAFSVQCLGTSPFKSGKEKKNPGCWLTVLKISTSVVFAVESVLAKSVSLCGS